MRMGLSSLFEQRPTFCVWKSLILRFLAARLNLTVLSGVASGSYRGGNKDYNDIKLGYSHTLFLLKSFPRPLSKVWWC
jgi:hypothetical protein